MTTDLIDILFILSGCKGFRNLIVTYANEVKVEYIDSTMDVKFKTVEEFINWIETL